MKKLVFVWVTFLLLSSESFAASPYTSVKNGAWNDPTTWGNTAASGDYPKMSGDLVNINHNITASGGQTDNISVDINANGWLEITSGDRNANAYRTRLLNGTSKLTISGNLNVVAGTFSSVSGSILTIGGTLSLTGATTAAQRTIDGSASVANISLTNNANLVITGSTSISGNVTTFNTSTLTINSSGSLTVTGSTTLNNTSIITNSGTFSSGSTTLNDARFTSSGISTISSVTLGGNNPVFNVSGGTTTISGNIDITGNGVTLTNSGTLNVANLNVGGNNNNITNNSTLKVTGNIALSSGTLTDNGAMTVTGSITMSNSKLKIYGTTRAASLTTTSAGDVNVYSGGKLTLDNFSGTFNTIAIAGDVVVNGNTSAEANFTVESTGTYYIKGNMTTLRRININGAVKVDGTANVQDFNVDSHGRFIVMTTLTANNINVNTGGCIYYVGTLSGGGNNGFDVTNGTTGSPGICNSSSMPIELIAFNAALASNCVLLGWQTASEKNNDYFTPEHSLDGSSFDELGKIPGAGSSTSTHNYSFADYNYSTGYNYYRLKQTDYDGVYSYSDVKTIYVGQYDSEEIKVSPTVVLKGASINVYGLGGKNTYTIRIVSIDGKINATYAVKNTNAKLLTSPDQEGVYFIEIDTNNFSKRVKIVVQ